LSRCVRNCPQYGNSFCLAGFAPLGFVFELFIVKEQLFPGREDEVGPAVDALQYFVLKFHGDAPFNQSQLRTLGGVVTRAMAQSFPYFLSSAAKY
jgi:hypothetical protein